MGEKKAGVDVGNTLVRASKKKKKAYVDPIVVIVDDDGDA